MNKKRKQELEERANAQVTIAGAKAAICNLLFNKAHTFREGIIEYALVNQSVLSSEELVCLVMGIASMDKEVLDSCPEDVIPDDIIWFCAKQECPKAQQKIILSKLNLEEVEQ